MDCPVIDSRESTLGMFQYLRGLTRLTAGADGERVDPAAEGYGQLARNSEAGRLSYLVLRFLTYGGDLASTWVAKL
jgi:hypothetical protein